MRLFRLLFVVPIALCALAVMSSPVSATVTAQLTVGNAKLGPLGASVTVPVHYTCDPSVNAAFVDVTVAQVFGHKLAQGTGSFVSNFPGVPCTGQSQTVTVTVLASGGNAFRKGGHAIANAVLTTFNPSDFTFATATVAGQPITISK